MEINYTIIIPHKNTPDLLQKCLDSIPVRPDVQVIVVDDNSDLGKVDFSNFPQWQGEKYECYLTKEGRGAGYARNVALKHAVGKWLIFADADDFFHPCLTDFMDQNMGADVDLICFKSDSINLSTGQIAHRSDGINSRIDIAIQSGDFHPVLMYACPTRKVFRRQLIVDNEIAFNEVPCANDVVFMAKVVSCNPRCAASDICAYCVTSNEYSIMTRTRRSPQSQEVRVQQDVEAAAFYKKVLTLSSDDKYWFFETWYQLYQLSMIRSLKYVVSMCTTVGCGPFIYNFLSRMKRKFNRNRHEK